MYLHIKVKDYLIVHGFDQNNKEIIEKITEDKFVEKIINVDRILSITEKYVLTQYAFGRIIYWEYEGDLSSISEKLRQANLMIEE